MTRTVNPIPKKPKRRAPSPAKEKARATKLWSQYIHARDKWCQRCGKTDGVLNAHHILVKKNYTAVRCYEGNGVLLCFRCHDVMHADSMAGVVFYTRLLGVDGYEALREKAYAGVGQKYPAAFWTGEAERLTRLLEQLG